ncbi:unnamed protein product [Somion occarium]|uniref:Uncharacterized protein n=1 Tax=Somion occarium TaxID=3059160 RepID=A0ABP1E9J6_9APHY
MARRSIPATTSSALSTARTGYYDRAVTAARSHAGYRQEVEVRVRANRWVLGFIVGILEACHSFGGAAYQVDYESDGARRVDPFPSDKIRPVGPREF